MTTVAPPVRIIVPGFEAFTEFPQVAGPQYPVLHDACGPNANMTCLNAAMRLGYTLDELIRGMIAIRQRDIDYRDASINRAPLFTAGSGQNLDDLEMDVHTWCPKVVTRKTPMGSPPEEIHAALKAACNRGNPCVLNLLGAGKLPRNEAGVEHHFVGVGGIDTNLGYPIANGDEFPFGHVGVYYVRWPDILAAQPYGLLEYEMQPLPPPIPPPPVPDIPAALASLATIETELAKAKAALG